MSKEIIFKLGGVLLYPLFYLTILLPTLAIYHPMVRLSGLSARPPFQIIPMNFFENAYHFYKERMVSYFPYQQIGLDAKGPPANSKNKNTLLIIVVGEAARAQNFSLNGYTRNTNAYTSKQNVLSFPRVSSCGTSTRVSIPCLFSSLKRADFSNIKAEHQDNLLDILSRVGFKVLWIDNNGAGDCQGVCKHVQSMITHDYDEKPVSEFASKIDSLPRKDTVVEIYQNKLDIFKSCRTG